MRRAVQILRKRRLAEAINPWQPPQPPHGLARPTGHPLEQAWLLRSRAQMPCDGYEDPHSAWPLLGAACLISAGVAGAMGAGMPLLPAALALVSLLVFLWSFTSVSRSFYQFWNIRAWEDLYRDAYLEVVRGDLPIALSGLEDALFLSASERSGIGLSGTASPRLLEYMLELARSHDSRGSRPQLDQEPGLLAVPLRLLQSLEMWRSGWDIRTRARYAALYDYLFSPQAALHELLDAGDPAAPPIPSSRR